MKRQTKRLPLLALGALLTLASATASADEKKNDDKTSPLTVVELFTSQSCSSCPPADKYLEELSAQDNVITMSCHVSYFNQNEWKDTLSHEFCDVRQHGYASLETPPKVYTPQMLVNGLNPFVGSHIDKAATALSRAKNQVVMPIEIQKNESLIRFMLPSVDFPVSGDFRIWMFGFKKSHTQDISAGENSGKQIHYVNAAITYTNLGGWKGDAISSIAPKPTEDVDGIIILAQAGGYGRIVAAGKLEFSKSD